MQICLDLLSMHKPSLGPVNLVFQQRKIHTRLPEFAHSAQLIRLFPKSSIAAFPLQSVLALHISKCFGNILLGSIATRKDEMTSAEAVKSTASLTDTEQQSYFHYNKPTSTSQSLSGGRRLDHSKHNITCDGVKGGCA